MVSCSGFSFGFWRFFEILILIPIVGMLAYFVDIYNKLNELTPIPILVLFIVATLAAAWAIGTLFLYTQAKHSANFVAFIDLLFVGAFIGAVYELRGISNAHCASFTQDPFFFQLGDLAKSGNVWSIHFDKHCAMLKASFAMGIMACIMFFITFLLALMVHHHWRGDRDRYVVKRETHYSRHGHHRSSRSPRRSHHSHSSRRSYHV